MPLHDPVLISGPTTADRLCAAAGDIRAARFGAGYWIVGFWPGRPLLTARPRSVPSPVPDGLTMAFCMGRLRKWGILPLVVFIGLHVGVGRMMASLATASSSCTVRRHTLGAHGRAGSSHSPETLGRANTTCLFLPGPQDCARRGCSTACHPRGLHSRCCLSTRDRVAVVGRTGACKPRRLRAMGTGDSLAYLPP